MNDVEDIFNRARNYLCSGWTWGKSAARSMGARIAPEVVFDHSRRVKELARILAKDPQVNSDQIDPVVLSTSCLFHDAGWVDLVKAGQLHPTEIFSRPADADILRRSTQVVCDQVGTLLADRLLEKVIKVIGEFKTPKPTMPEGLALCDADNLEDFGLLGFTLQFRCAHLAGKSVQQVVEGWQRQQEYHYWEARIKSALHLEMSRSIARRRLESMGKAFELLQREIAFDDLKDPAGDLSVAETVKSFAR